MTEYRNLTGGTDLVAIDEDGLVISFAAFDLDKENSIGEFDPVGTLPRFQRKGFSRAVILDGLARMKKAGMTKAIVRTATFAIPAINAYQAIGFEEVDRSVRYTMPIKH